jgi:hypothetical protein
MCWAVELRQKIHHQTDKDPFFHDILLSKLNSDCMSGAVHPRSPPFCLADTPVQLYTNRHRSPLLIRSFDYLVLHHRQDHGKVLHAGFLRPAVKAEGDQLYRSLEAQRVPGIAMHRCKPVLISYIS